MGCRGPCLSADAMTGAERSYITPLGLHPLAAILPISTHKKIGTNKFSGWSRCGLVRARYPEGNWYGNLSNLQLSPWIRPQWWTKAVMITGIQDPSQPGSCPTRLCAAGIFHARKAPKQNEECRLAKPLKKLNNLLEPVREAHLQEIGEGQSFLVCVITGCKDFQHKFSVPG